MYSYGSFENVRQHNLYKQGMSYDILKLLFPFAYSYISPSTIEVDISYRTSGTSRATGNAYHRIP
jgi:hypothetical protein